MCDEDYGCSVARGEDIYQSLSNVKSHQRNQHQHDCQRGIEANGGELFSLSFLHHLERILFNEIVL